MPTEFIVEGQYAAEVGVTLIETGGLLAPHIPKLEISRDDTKKLDAVRLALRRGDLAAAAKLARVYELKPVAAE